ncbi:MAG: ABC transporter ATP-binding protein [Oscillospiraceae bacterium]|nr:ABC transporter ATP-binding protein [Oscillospiraceae bacterium]
MENAIVIKNLCKIYSGFELKDVSFNLPKGYIMGFAGQNGAGKTTTIRSILNMIKINSGEITIFGKDNIKYEREIKQDVGVVLDELYFTRHLKIKSIEAQLKMFYDNWNSEVFKSYIERFKLPYNKKCGDFSKGMKMKLMIAAALAHDAKLLILDEPTSGLDPVARDELLDIFGEIIEDGEHSILFSTHITADIERVADYLTILYNGKIYETGEKDEIMEKYVVIKGDAADINEEIKKHTIGFHNYRNGFESLYKAEYTDLLPDSVVVEKASIDEIMVYIAKEG